MTDNMNQNVPLEATRTPGSAEGERDPADQNDRADDSIVGQADDDDDDEFDDDELDEDEEDEEDEEESDEEAQ